MHLPSQIYGLTCKIKGVLVTHIRNRFHLHNFYCQRHRKKKGKKPQTISRIEGDFPYFDWQNVLFVFCEVLIPTIIRDVIWVWLFVKGFDSRFWRFWFCSKNIVVVPITFRKSFHTYNIHLINMMIFICEPVLCSYKRQ